MARGKHSRRGRGSRNRPQPMIHRKAGGIDVGAREIYVAVPEDRAPQPMRIFDTFTPDLIQSAEWLVACKSTTVAIEATSVYWTLGGQEAVNTVRACSTFVGERLDLPMKPTAALSLPAGDRNHALDIPFVSHVPAELSQEAPHAQPDRTCGACGGCRETP